MLSAFQLHQLALKRFISKYLNNAQDIEDVTQEAFMRAYSAEKTTLVRQPKSFLFRIAKNVAISQLRTKSRQITDYIEDQPTADVLLSEWSTEDEVMAQQKLGIHCEAVASAATDKCQAGLPNAQSLRHVLTKRLPRGWELPPSTVEETPIERR